MAKFFDAATVAKLLSLASAAGLYILSTYYPARTDALMGLAGMAVGGVLFKRPGDVKGGEQ